MNYVKNPIVITVSDLASRKSAAAYRMKVLKAITGGHMVTLDLSAVESISSSFADELFGILALQIGPRALISNVKINGAKEHVYLSISRAIHSRLNSQDKSAA